MKYLLLILTILNFSLFAQMDEIDKERNELYKFLKENGKTSATDDFDIAELDGVICRVMVNGFSPIPQCGIIDEKMDKHNKSIERVLSLALKKKVAAGIHCRALVDVDNNNKPLGIKCGSDNRFPSIAIKKCRFPTSRHKLTRILRNGSRGCSQDSSICFGTVQCEGEPRTAVACAPINGSCEGISASECVDDNDGIQVHRPLGGTGADAPLKSSKSKKQNGNNI